MSVVTRIPPSPTGHFHIGTARTALFNYLFAKQQGGTFIFRSEDTDKARSSQEYEEEILEGLAWLRLPHDAFYRQSEHAGRHQEVLTRLIQEGKAYISEEPSKDNPDVTVEVVRLKNPGRSVTFRDEIRGDITFDTTELGDFVIARSVTDPLYHFAVVVDDFDEGVTHVIRGEDHVSNTPRQILIQEAIGAPRPVYAHLPLILDENRAKLSKRSSSGVPLVLEFRSDGMLPEAILNYLALLGWNPGTNEEYFTLPQLVERFSLAEVQKSGAAWDREKLLSINQHWMRKLSDDAFLTHVGLTKSHMKVVPLLKERARTFGEARQLLKEELSCLFETPTLDKGLLAAKEPVDRPGLTKTALEALLEPLNALPEGVAAEAVKQALMPLADAEEAKGKGGRGGMLWPLRYALSGKERSPDPFTLISLLGPQEAVSRVQKAIDILGG